MRQLIWFRENTELLEFIFSNGKCSCAYEMNKCN